MRRLAICVLVLAGCAVGPNFERPKAPKVAQYASGKEPTRTEGGEQSQRFAKGRDVTGDWWHLFKSKAIDDIVARAISSNQNLEAARASLRRSQNAMRAGYGAFFPQVDVQLGASYERISPLRFGQNRPATNFALYSASGTVSYALDIWGGQRRQVEALTAQVEAQRYTLAGAHVMLCANIVDAVIARAGYTAQIAATRATVELEKQQLRITEAQASAGSVPFANVLAIKAQVASTEALVPALEQRVDQADHLLATLAGQAPGSWTPRTVGLDDLALPLDVPVSLPSRLVRQRADILVAEALLHAANAQIGVATAAMLPNITLSASGGGNSTKLGSLFDANGLFGSVGGGLVAPIFHGGTLWYQRKAAIDARDQAFAVYKQTVLEAFEQVADSLRALEHDAEALKAQKEALDAAEEAWHLVEDNYHAGTASYVQVIVANEQYLQAKTAHVQSVSQRLQDTVALYVATGGGWWNTKSL